MRDLSAILASHEGPGYVVAPAGYGKTYLIAQSTARSLRRQLILTHTYAGVNALRRKLRLLGVSEGLYRVDTLASWALRLSLAYPATSGWTGERPADNEQWAALYEACGRLLDNAFVRRIVRASYGGLYVDEYQDCSIAQHRIVLKLARDLPCRILGDPLQGIFDFGDQGLVDWASDVEDRFESLGALNIPHRWLQTGAEDLGVWLSRVRSWLEQGRPIDLSAARPAAVRVVICNPDSQALLQSQGNTCRYFDCDRGHTVVAIHKGAQEYKAKCHKLARNLSGRFSSIEEVEGKALFSFIGKVGRARTDSARLTEVIAFACTCMTGVKANLPAGTIRGESVNVRVSTRNPVVAGRANDYLVTPTSTAMAKLLIALKETPSVKIIRSDLFNRVIGVLRKHELHPDLSLTEAAEKYHGEFRYKGRPLVRRRIIGTTLLVKGLEFDHAIILDAPSLSRKELYVALTRGSRTLTIVSTGTILTPAE